MLAIACYFSGYHIAQLHLSGTPVSDEFTLLPGGAIEIPLVSGKQKIVVEDDSVCRATKTKSNCLRIDATGSGQTMVFVVTANSRTKTYSVSVPDSVFLD